MFDIDPRFLAVLGMTCTVNSSEWKANSVNELLNTYRNVIMRCGLDYVTSEAG